MGKSKKTKSQYWQMVRGICILAVIMIHCPSGQNYTELDYNAWIVFRQFINFPVAMFIFLAGYFMTPEKTQGDYKTFLCKRGGKATSPIPSLEQCLFTEDSNI